MFTTIIRIIIIYFFILVLLRLMGKRQIGELQPFELVITLIFADIATVPMGDANIPIINGLLPLFMLVTLQFFLTFMSKKSLFLRKLINGKPVIIINPNGIDYANLKALNMSLNDLQEALRGCEVSNFEDVQYALIETNGKASVILKANVEPATREDLKVKVEENGLPILIVNEGKILQDNAKLADLNEDDINEILKKSSVVNLKDVLVMNIDNNGKIYLQPKNGKYEILQYKFDGGENW